MDLFISPANAGHAVEQHTIQRKGKAKTQLTHPLITDELLTKQTLHSACWERDGQIGWRRTHKVDTARRDLLTGSQVPNTGFCVERTKEPAELAS